MTDVLGLGHKAHWKKIQQDHMRLSTYHHARNVAYFAYLSISLTGEESFRNKTCMVNISFVNIKSHSQFFPGQLLSYRLANGLPYHGKIHYSLPDYKQPKQLSFDDVDSTCSNRGGGHPFFYDSYRELYDLSAYLSKAGYVKRPIVIFTGSGTSHSQKVLSVI